MSRIDHNIETRREAAYLVCVRSSDEDDRAFTRDIERASGPNLTKEEIRNDTPKEEHRIVRQRVCGRLWRDHGGYR